MRLAPRTPNTPPFIIIYCMICSRATLLGRGSDEVGDLGHARRHASAVLAPAVPPTYGPHHHGETGGADESHRTCRGGGACVGKAPRPELSTSGRSFREGTALRMSWIDVASQFRQLWRAGRCCSISRYVRAAPERLQVVQSVATETRPRYIIEACRRWAEVLGSIEAWAEWRTSMSLGREDGSRRECSGVAVGGARPEAPRSFARGGTWSRQKMYHARLPSAVPGLRRVATIWIRFDHLQPRR
ncbi:hypothetical protein FA95DRAFT_655609 [Auriscalpium vulgare]|uniref:Uncharacterized protein n=1 Tax=Auriscalpium vulgare TaxID=40419 RepID=A0ACB8RCY9_9AGAM|nr:hypothetical protein FA95DRAFT_655609 [Auriscalpium vulgare]